jgi:hypothetical protein
MGQYCLVRGNSIKLNIDLANGSGRFMGHDEQCVLFFLAVTLPGLDDQARAFADGISGFNGTPANPTASHQPT